MIVAGLDACKSGWVCVTLEDARFVGAEIVATAADALARWPEVDVVAIDIPIGLPGDGDVGFPRAADKEARSFLAGWGAASSVFTCPSARVLVSATYTEALSAMRATHEVGISAQAYALASKIFEVRAGLSQDPRVVEGHPELEKGADARPAYALLAVVGFAGAVAMS